MARLRRRSWIVIVVAVTLLLLCIGTGAIFVTVQYHYVDPTYTEAMEAILRQHRDVDMYIPTWMIEGYMPQDYTQNGRMVFAQFSNSKSDVIEFYACPGSGTNYNKNVDRSYTVRRKGIEFLYQEVVRGDNMSQCFRWHNGTFSISYSADKVENKLSEDDLLHIAMSVKKFPKLEA